MSPSEFDEIDMATALNCIIVYQEEMHQMEISEWRRIRWQTANLMNSTGNYKQAIRERDLLPLPGDKAQVKRSKSADELMGALMGFAKKLGKDRE